MRDYSRWMSNLDDNTAIASLSLPGTHNSEACHKALPSVRCQGQHVEEQLNHGVRFLDLRVSRNVLTLSDDNANNLVVVHSKFPIKLIGQVYLDEVLEGYYKWIADHPSETVFVSLKQEGPNNWDNENDEFGKVIWEKYVGPNKDKWYLRPDLPRLRDARGKLILFRRFGVKDLNKVNGNQDFGFDAHYWNYNTTADDRGTFCVQDLCEMNTNEDVRKKADAIKDFIGRAVQYNETNSNHDKLFVNFCSGSNFFDKDLWPEEVAKDLISFRVNEKFARGSGIIVLDYAETDDWKLVRELVDKNF